MSPEQHITPEKTPSSISKITIPSKNMIRAQVKETGMRAAEGSLRIKLSDKGIEVVGVNTARGEVTSLSISANQQGSFSVFFGHPHPLVESGQASRLDATHPTEKKTNPFQQWRNILRSLRRTVSEPLHMFASDSEPEDTVRITEEEIQAAKDQVEKEIARPHAFNLPDLAQQTLQQALGNFELDQRTRERISFAQHAIEKATAIPEPESKSSSSSERTQFPFPIGRR